MTRNINTATREWIETERSLDPLALGPYLGALAVELNIPLQLLAKTLGFHEQTVYRWITKRVDISPTNITKVVKVLSLLCWMHETKRRPLRGNTTQQEHQLALAFADFFTRAGTSQKATTDV